MCDFLWLEVVGQFYGHEAGETLRKHRVGDLIELGPPVHGAPEPDVLQVAELLVGVAEVIQKVPQQLHGDLGMVEVDRLELHQTIGDQRTGVWTEIYSTQVEFLQGERFRGLCKVFLIYTSIL